MDPTLQSQSATVVIPQSTPHNSSSSARAAAAVEEGRFLPGALVAGRYRIISLLGSGGMGEVYRATDLTLAQPVALKFLTPSAEHLIELFHNEVRVARQVTHPNVCRVYDVGESDGLPYISMEYVDGEDLASLLTRIGRLPTDKALEIARKICAGLSAAHEKGVIHRDLKPANIMLDKRGHVVVMDFGLAALANRLQGAESRSGTPAYMSPEQLRGEEVTPRSDIYALGLVLYELFTGKRAYEAASLPELIDKQESGQITSMSTIAVDVDPSVEKAVRRCLEPDPADRPSSVLAVVAALPGGDPLAAALAAGETPSPELVAASGSHAAISLRLSLLVLAATLVLIAGLPVLRTNFELHSLVPYELSPDTLAARIRDIAASFGYTAIPADRKYDLHWSQEIYDQARGHVSNPAAARQWYQGESPLVLGYRESPQPLMAPPDGEVTEDRPAPLLSGMIEAWVNSTGALRKFRAVPPQVATGTETRDIDTGLISKATGFEIANWQPTAPRFTPLYAFDWIKAWSGKHPVLQIPVTVQASAWRGRITELSVIWPWTQAERTPKSHDLSLKELIRLWLGRVMWALLFVFSVLLAARNLRAGRGDRRGALRLAIALFILHGLAWLCGAHWTADTGMLGVITFQAADWAVNAALFWLLYIALEPLLRAGWPQSIVTWSRMLAGRWRDPLVSAHVLYGTLIGVLIAWFITIPQWLPFAEGLFVRTAPADSGSSSRAWLGYILFSIADELEFGLAVVFAIFGFRWIFRKDWIASIAAALTFSALEGAAWHNSGLLNYAFLAIIFTLLAFVLLRLGLVSTVMALFVLNILLQTPGAQNLSKPYEWAVIMYPLVPFVLALWAFWGASGRQLLEVDRS